MRYEDMNNILIDIGRMALAEVQGLDITNEFTEEEFEVLRRKLK